MLCANMDLELFCSQAILSCTNNRIAKLNTLIFKDLSSKEHIFEFINQADYSRKNSNNQRAYELPIRFFRSINILSLPSTQLQLKIGISIMLMQNLHDQDELCISIRLVITQLHKYCIKAQILSSKFDSQPQVLFCAFSHNK